MAVQSFVDVIKALHERFEPKIRFLIKYGPDQSDGPEQRTWSICKIRTVVTSRTLTRNRLKRSLHQLQRYSLCVKMVILALVLCWCFLCPRENNSQNPVIKSSGNILLLHSESVWVPTCVRGPRHYRFLRSPLRTRTLPLFVHDLSRRKSTVILLIILLSGDIELNPGPSGNEVKCVCLSARESGHMIQCEHCSRWSHSKCVGVIPSVADSYPFICPFCVKSAISSISTLHSEISKLQAIITQLEDTCKHIPADVRSVRENSDSLADKVQSLPCLLSTAQPVVQPQTQPAFTTQHSANDEIPPTALSSQANPERKFNVIIIGLRESSKGTPRRIRLTSDLTAITATLSSLDSSITIIPFVSALGLESTMTAVLDLCLCD